MVGPVHRSAKMAVQQRTYIRSGIEPKQAGVSRSLTHASRFILRSVVEVAGNEAVSQIRPQPWDCIGPVGRSPVRGSHGRNPAPPLQYDLSARLCDIHLGREIAAKRAGVARPYNPPKISGLTESFAREGRSAVARQSNSVETIPLGRRLAHVMGALVNGSSKGLLAGVKPARGDQGTVTFGHTPPG
jgi:hypothetical protein